MRIAFFGTSAFAATVLGSLIDNGAGISAVFTKPDRAAGRGRHLRASPVKVTAQAHSLPVLQPETWSSDARSALARLQVDLGIVVAYGVLLPEAVLEVPRLGCINLHSSRLPRWRGAAPVARAIEAGDAVTGISLIKLVAELDAGPVLDQRNCAIEAHDTTALLEYKLVALGEKMLNSFLKLTPQRRRHLLDNARPQGQVGVCHAPRLSKTEAKIDWQRTAVEIERKIRALNPWPVAHTHLGTLTIRVWGSRAHPEATANKRPGHMDVRDRHLFVHCGQGVLEITKLQLPGKKVMSTPDFLNGHQSRLMDSAATDHNP